MISNLLFNKIYFQNLKLNLKQKNLIIFMSDKLTEFKKMFEVRFEQNQARRLRLMDKEIIKFFRSKCFRWPTPFISDLN